MEALADHESLRMYDVSEALKPRIEALRLEQNVEDLKRDGYTVLKDVASPNFIAALREQVLRFAAEDGKQYFGITQNGEACDLLLGRHPVFAEAVLNPKVMAIAEFLCGRDCALMELAGSVKRPGAPALVIHSDQDWIPAPFPEHNAFMVAAWACDPFSREAGCTKVMPGTHKLRRHPTPQEVTAEAGAIPVECEPGSVVVWGGALWHGSYARTSPGERVVLHASYSRLAYRPVEDYSHLDAAFLAGQPPEMATLLGRNYYMGYGGNPRFDMGRFPRMWSAARR